MDNCTEINILIYLVLKIYAAIVTFILRITVMTYSRNIMPLKGVKKNVVPG